MMINSKAGYSNEKPYDEAIKELFYFITGGNSGQFEVGPDSEEITQAKTELDKFLNENLKDRDLLEEHCDLLSTLLLVTESQGFVDGFKVASMLSTRKSALIKLNETLSKKAEG
ncbi:MAG: hypothetical protein K0Q87_1712 [Neobacillus sp.]|jgi:hypothetical protein|nr:hypothetical protein [Neobacillus sp.]